MEYNMREAVDCLFIGHNEVDFVEYEKRIRSQGIHSGAFRDLNLNFIGYNDRPYTASGLFNALSTDNSSAPVFSAAIAYLGTYLYRRGISFDYVNAFQEEKDRLLYMLRHRDILTAAITTTLYMDMFPILEIMDFIRTHNTGINVVVGGPYILSQVRSLPPDQLNYLFASIGADFYVNSSQGEAALVEIIRSLKNDSPPGRINNIYYRTHSGYVSTPVSMENNKLSENMVNWDLFAPRVGESAAVRTSISCPFSCSFCGYPEYAGPYQTVDVQLIEDELNCIDKIESVKSVNFVDDTFNVPVQRFKEILRRMSGNRRRFKWHSYFRCQYTDEEMVELMKESGCEGVFLGLESGNNRILENMKKGVDRETYLKGIEWLKKYDIVTFGSFIIGFPGETPESVRDTVGFIEASGLDFFRVQLWACEPTAPIMRKKEKYGLEGANFEWSHAAMDAKTAADWVDKLFLSLDRPVWVPQYNFNFQHIFHLLHRGMGLEKIKGFLQLFNRGIREKLANPDKREVSGEIIAQIKKLDEDIFHWDLNENDPDQDVDMILIFSG
jgi:radical SAM PhpK family P-methyltransferase